MATTDQELKKLNRTVEDAVNIIKVYVGNSANIKNMNEKQREAINKWFDVTVEEEEQQKKQRAFTERQRDEHGRFIKKQDDQAKKMMGLAESVTGMFKGMAKVVGTGLTKAYQSISVHFMNFFNNMKSHFLGLFGEESEWFDILSSIKDSLMGFVGWFAKGFSALFRKTPSWAKDQIKVLKGMYALQIKQMKMDFLDASPEKKGGGLGVWGTLGLILTGIAAGIGAWLHRYLVLLTRLPIFGRIATMFSKIDDIPFIGKLFKAVKFGFKWLGWPLTIILSTIDFIRGYAETEGSMFDKIKNGLWKAIEGFIELPVRFIGWVTEKVLGMFGIKAEGIAGKMMDGLKQAFGMVLDGWVLIFEILKTSVISIVNLVAEWIKKIPWLPMKDKVVQGIDSLKSSFGFTPETTSPIDSVQQADKAKIENQKEGYKLLGSALDGMGESIKASNRQTGNAMNSILSVNQNNQNSGGGDNRQQIPDEIDNGMVSMNNLGWEMM